MMRLFLHLAMLVAFALPIPATAADAAHDQIQSFLNAVQSGANFSQSEFKDAIDSKTAEQLAAVKSCPLDSVSRMQGDAMAIIHWNCPGGEVSRKVSAMVEFDQGKIKSVVFVSFVQVDVK